SIRLNLAAQKYEVNQSVELHTQMASLEAEWRKIGIQLSPILVSGQRPDWSKAPAVARAAGESSFLEIKPYYDSSLEYGKSTSPDSGLFYIGSALAQKQFAELCATIRDSQNTGKFAAPNLAAEMDAYEDELLAAYKPPQSIDSHPMFIRTSAL